MILQVKSILFIFILLNFSFSKAQLMSEFNIKTGKMATLESKIKASKEAVRDSLKNMHHSKDENEQKNMFKEALTQHSELLKSVKEYNTLRQELKYKFPKKSDSTTRQYLPLREETLEEIENELGLSGILNRIKSKIDKKYQTFTTKDLKPLAKPNQQLKDDEKQPLRLEK
jgi:hypothetical protein